MQNQNELFNKLENIKNDIESVNMSAYMQNKFSFLGIKKPILNEIIKPFLKDSKQYDIDWKFVSKCWQKDYREYQYVAIEYLLLNIKKIIPSDINKIENLIVNKSWWETVDSLDTIVGQLVLLDSTLEDKMLLWSKSDNIWLKRVSIDYQQKYKEKTNKELLERIIINNLNSNEFFINKAIGWSLREYSKTNKEWVIAFLKKYNNKLNKLSIKEASKYL